MKLRDSEICTLNALRSSGYERQFWMHKQWDCSMQEIREAWQKASEEGKKALYPDAQ